MVTDLEEVEADFDLDGRGLVRLPIHDDLEGGVAISSLLRRWCGEPLISTEVHADLAPDFFERADH